MFLLEQEHSGTARRMKIISFFYFRCLLVLNTQWLLSAGKVFVGEAKGYPPVCSAGMLMESAQLSCGVCWFSAHVYLHPSPSPTMSLIYDISAAKYITTHFSLDPEEACHKL